MADFLGKLPKANVLMLVCKMPRRLKIEGFEGSQCPGIELITARRQTIRVGAFDLSNLMKRK